MLRDGAGTELAVPRAMKETVGSTVYPTLTRTNYGGWTLLMRVILQARGLRSVIKDDADVDNEVDYRNDRMALEAILRAVLPEMLTTLAVKKTAKEA